MKTVLTKGFFPAAAAAVLALSCGVGIASAVPTRQALAQTPTLSRSVQSQLVQGFKIIKPDPNKPAAERLLQMAEASPGSYLTISSGPHGYIEYDLYDLVGSDVPYIRVHLDKYLGGQLNNGLGTAGILAGIASQFAPIPQARVAAKAVAIVIAGTAAIVNDCKSGTTGEADVYFANVSFPLVTTLPVPVCNPFAH